MNNIIIEKVEPSNRIEAEEFKSFQPIRFMNTDTSEIAEFWHRLSFPSIVNRLEKELKWDRKAIQAAIKKYKSESRA